MCLDDKLGSAPAPLVVPEVGQLRQPSGNLSDGGVYMCNDTTHAAAATVEVAFSGGEWHVSDPDATEDDDDAVAMVHVEGSAATKGSFANWAELPDGILREVGILSHLAERYTQRRRRVQNDRWPAKCDMQNAT
jgi:predicted dehydrogenase